MRYGTKNQQTIEVITNQMSWTANTINQLYKARWEVEIFFRVIKIAITYQILYRHKPKCVDDTDLDSIYNDNNLKSPKIRCKTRVVFV
ncbi:MAG: transposase [Flavobacteriales bacterium]|nr:transposase [Flavobacteriales bacterium]